MRSWLARLAAHLALAKIATWTAPRLRQGLMPFQAAHRLEPRERWLVIEVWGALGGIVGCAWLALLAALVSPLRQGSGWLVFGVLLAGAVCFFAGAGYLMTAIGNRLVGHTRNEHDHRNL